MTEVVKIMLRLREYTGDSKIDYEGVDMEYWYYLGKDGKYRVNQETKGVELQTEGVWGDDW